MEVVFLAFEVREWWRSKEKFSGGGDVGGEHVNGGGGSDGALRERVSDC